MTRFGKINILKSGRYIREDCNGFGISPYMRELLTYAGQLDCYCRCEEIMERFTQVTVNAAQVYRVTEHVSESLASEDEKVERINPPVSKEDVLYVEMDGSMVCTRGRESWKEVKLGRLFNGSDCLNPDTDASYLCASQYVGHFGGSSDFGTKLGNVIDSYGELKNRLVFICDGAAWIREWITEKYPESISILDFFHVMEHLYDFAEKAFVNDVEKKEWCTKQKELLLASGVETVIENIDSTQAGDIDKKKLICYFKNNIKRMRYGKFRRIGCGIIGSGAIESAHRTVIQKRMKLSGQRWSAKGVENMLRLRLLNMNKQWSKIIEFVKKPQNKMAA